MTRVFDPETKEGFMAYLGTNLTFAACRDAVLANDGSLSYHLPAQLQAGSTTDRFNNLGRGYVYFDLTGLIPADATITACQIASVVYNKNVSLGDTTVAFVSWAPADAANWTYPDWDEIGSTPLTDSLSTTALSTDGNAIFTFNTTGVEYVNTNRDGLVCLCFRSGWDINNAFTGTWASGESTTLYLNQYSVLLRVFYDDGKWVNALPYGPNYYKRNLLPAGIARGSEDSVIDDAFFAVNSLTCTSSTEQAWEGSRSVKVVTDGAVVDERWRTAYVRVTPEQNYTVSCYLRGSGTVALQLHEADASGTWLDGSEGNMITLTNTWTRYSLTRELAYTTGVNIALGVTTWTQQAITYYVDGIQIERGTAATEWGTEPGLIKNRFYKNVADGCESGYYTDSVDSGFGENQSGTTLSVDATEYWQGSRSLKIVCDGTAEWQGIDVYPFLAVEPGEAYVLSFYLKGTASGHMVSYLYEWNATPEIYAYGRYQHIVPTGTWTRYEIPVRVGPLTKKIEMVFVTETYYTATVYIDGLQLERVNSPNLIRRANQANCCEDGTTGEFAINSSEGTLYVESTEHYQGTKCLKVVTNSSQAYEGAMVDTNVTNITVGKTYTISAYFKAASGTAGLLVGWYTSTFDWIDETTAPVTMDGTWKRVTLTDICPATAANLSIWVCTAGVQQALTFYVDAIQVEEGSHATAWDYPAASDWGISDTFIPQDWIMGMPRPVIIASIGATYPITLTAEWDAVNSHIDLTWSDN